MTTTKTNTEIPVSWRLDEIDIEASLTLPAGDGPFPVVVMVAGSGPTDRNWNSPLILGTNGSAALLARALTKKGFATLRYDKRASGPRGKENALKLAGKISMQGHTDELAGGIKLLAMHAKVNPSHIFALTNSEGAIHALHYQIQVTDLPFAGLILAAPPARPVGVVARGQIASQLKPVPGGDKWLAAYEAVIADFSAGNPVNIDESLPEGLRNMLLSLTSPINLPFSRELWMVDASKLLGIINVPVLVVIGKKDIQVDWQTDGSILAVLTETHRNITIAYPENANHVLKHESRERSQLTAAEAMASYNADTSTLDAESLTLITDWLAQQIK